MLTLRWYIFYSFQWQVIQITATQEEINMTCINVVSDALVVNFF